MLPMMKLIQGLQPEIPDIGKTSIEILGVIHRNLAVRGTSFHWQRKVPGPICFMAIWGWFPMQKPSYHHRVQSNGRNGCEKSGVYSILFTSVKGYQIWAEHCGETPRGYESGVDMPKKGMVVISNKRHQRHVTYQTTWAPDTVLTPLCPSSISLTIMRLKRNALPESFKSATCGYWNLSYFASLSSVAANTSPRYVTIGCPKVVGGFDLRCIPILYFSRSSPFQLSFFGAAICCYSIDTYVFIYIYTYTYIYIYIHTYNIIQLYAEMY